MKVGLAKQCITPDLPVYLSGFAAMRKAESKLDDLFVKVVVYENDHKLYGILTYDLVALDRLVIDRVKDGMRKQNLEDEHFLFTATHTHSGPGGSVDTEKGMLKPVKDIFIETDPKLVNNIVQKSLQALQAALDNLQEANVTYASSTLANVGDNRNRRDFKGNNDLVAVFIEQEHGKKAILLNFACHPTIMNGVNKKVSADFPGAIDQCMGDHDYDMCLYLNGSCGDISTRFSRKSSDESEVSRYGKLFETKLMEMIKTANKIVIDDLQIAHKQFTMNLKKADTVENAEAELAACTKRVEEAKQKGLSGSDLRIIESYREGAEANLRLATHAYTETTYDVPMMFIKMNDHVAVCVPGELFSELSNPLQNENVHFIGYANGYLGYFANEFAYDNFYYEALSSPFEKGQSELMMTFIDQQIQTLLRKEH